MNCYEYLSRAGIALNHNDSPIRDNIENSESILLYLELSQTKFRQIDQHKTKYKEAKQQCEMRKY